MIQTFMAIKEQLENHSTSAPLFALIAVARVVYQRHQEQLQQQHQDQHRHRYLLPNIDTEDSKDEEDEDDVSRFKCPSPVKEWSVVAKDNTKTLTLVYYPEEEVREEVPEENTEPSQENTLILVIPGNPGNPYYYVPLMQEIIKKHGRSHEVRCLSHAGHVIPWKTHNRDFTLQEQMDHKMFYIKRRLCEDPTLRLIMVGHSIGSHIALHVAKQFPGNISKLVLMQPVIMHVALSRKGKQFMAMLNNYEFVVMFIGLVDNLVPVSLRRWFVRRSIGSQAEETVRMASLSLVNSCVIQNVLGMAANEMAEVVELDESLVTKHEDKTLFVYSTVDEWVPGEFMQEFQLRFVKAQHRVVPHGHAFMLEPDGSRDVAEHISQWIGDSLKKKV
ncbi:Lipid droplet-associated hydrolase [Phytophthora citrophthora]|uniref:Lipid droplet-associated hydrolase n=1 Tax=Phytophthora citrophthora TaxID=4793 RepID=A0AAD9G2K6_9STRA|nr:Lipid droplet-associated hydrolase [Phytophthora citrophthora]